MACHLITPNHYIDGLMQEKRNSSALALELRLPCLNPSIYWLLWCHMTLPWMHMETKCWLYRSAEHIWKPYTQNYDHEYPRGNALKSFKCSNDQRYDHKRHPSGRPGGPRRLVCHMYLPAEAIMSVTLKGRAIRNVVKWLVGGLIPAHI